MTSCNTLSSLDFAGCILRIRGDKIQMEVSKQHNYKRDNTGDRSSGVLALVLTLPHGGTTPPRSFAFRPTTGQIVASLFYIYLTDKMTYATGTRIQGFSRIHHLHRAVGLQGTHVSHITQVSWKLVRKDACRLPTF